MFTVRATKRLLDRTHAEVNRGPAPTPTTQLGDWYATLLRWRKPVVLFVNEATLVPVAVPLAPSATLVPRFVVALSVLLSELGVDPTFAERETAEMREYRYDKTANRSMVGAMTDFSFLADVRRERNNEVDLAELSLQLAGTPCSPLKSHHFPDNTLHALIAGELT